MLSPNAGSGNQNGVNCRIVGVNWRNGRRKRKSGLSKSTIVSLSDPHGWQLRGYCMDAVWIMYGYSYNPSFILRCLSMDPSLILRSSFVGKACIIDKTSHIGEEMRLLQGNKRQSALTLL